MLEKSVEDHLRRAVESRGGLCLKLNPKGYKGIPDRLVVLPGPRVMFVELKRPKGGVVAALQLWWYGKLRRLNVEAHFISTLEQVDALFSA